ncbi:MAG TPA: MFS transporter [Trebonia sp.]|nr:MFS transporter [Trebonia sp.]
MSSDTQEIVAPEADDPRPRSSGYKWAVLINTTIGTLMATIDSSIVLISLPAIFRGINMNPLTASNTSYLLWMLMGYMIVTAVLVVTFGRIGDMYGRVKMYNLGFAIFTIASLAASLTYFGGSTAALYLIVMRIVQGIGGAMIMANSAAILTDAFPANQRGTALGINSVAGIAGTFIGLVAGGLLAVVDWYLIFYVSVPVGVAGTLWGYLKLQEVAKNQGGRLDVPGNVLFAVGLIAVLAGIIYALQPYGGSAMGWRNPLVIGFLGGGVAMLVAFVAVELRVADPMFDMRLFRIREFVFGNLASLLCSIGRGGLMFMLIIWLQGIWLPLHGYDFESTPLWAGIYMLPLTGGFLIAGPVSGWLSDRFGTRPFATGGMVASAVTFGLLMLLPVNFSYGWFAVLLLVNGLSNGLFAAPNTSSIMSSVPASRRGVASGMRSTFQNAGMTLSIGLFFTIMVAGLTSSLHASLTHGLTDVGLSSAAAAKIANLPPVSVLFAAFLGYNPMQMLLGPAIGTLPPARQAVVTGHEFFPGLISGPFHQGLAVVFTFALVVCLIAAAASWLHGSTVPGETPEPSADVTPQLTTEPLGGHQCPLPAASQYCQPTSARLRSRSSPSLTPTLIR